MKTALVIEDNENNMELITFILEINEYEIRKANSGYQAVELARQIQPDLIILDIQLPDIDGLQVLKLIRKDGIAAPVIAMTSYAMAGDREKLLASGCNGYIEKPIDPERVMTQIEQIIGACA